MKPVKTRQKTGDRWFGERLQRRREQAGLSQDDLATKAREAGFHTWVRETVAIIEAGRRTLDMWEFLWLTVLFPNLQYVDFFRIDLPEKGENIQITPALVVDSSSLPSFFSGHANPARRPSLQLLEARIAESRDAEVKAARRLGVTPDEIYAASMKLWRCTLSRKRDIRAAEEGKDLAPASLQAKRGIITRQLIEELKQKLRKDLKTHMKRRNKE